MKFKELFNDKNDINEKSVIGFLAFIVMTLFATADIVTGYFGSEEPVKKDAFTATDDITTKTYDLSTLPKKDYDLLFIDVDGKEVKFPLVIK